MRTVQTAPITALLAQVMVIAGLAVTVSLGGAGLSPAAWAVGLTCGAITSSGLARGLSYYRADGLRPADWVTLARATLAVGVAVLVADSFGAPAPVTLLVSVAAVALALDAVDGFVARRTRTTAKLGAQFDAEVDAFLILALSFGWNQVGNGSIYNRTPEIHETGAFWSNSPRVQAAYGTSIVYALNTLTSFVQHYGKKNLVMIVLGDHQPLPVVSGPHPNHDVPISIIAHDPKVLKRIGSWGWAAGLRPRHNAPVWPMSAFRNQFLTAFDSKPAAR